MSELRKGENAIVRRNLFEEDGVTPISLSSLDSLEIQIRQYNRLLASYDYFENTPDDEEISEGSSTNQVKVQITQELSAKFKEGPVYIKILGKQANASYTVDGGVYDIDEEECFEVIL
jgi:hypothetical protein